jgi:hypothetical protein
VLKRTGTAKDARADLFRLGAIVLAASVVGWFALSIPIPIIHSTRTQVCERTATSNLDSIDATEAAAAK